MTSSAVAARYDAVVVGGGHNGLVAAAYLGRAGWSVLVLERADQVGGAAVSRQVFEGVDVRLSAYSYLVSLLPDRIVADLGLELTLADRPVASWTATDVGGRPQGGPDQPQQTSLASCEVMLGRFATGLSVTRRAPVS